MDLLKYFKRKENLPHPRGLLSASISPLAIASANHEVEGEISRRQSKAKKRGPYKKYVSYGLYSTKPAVGFCYPMYINAAWIANH